MKNKLAPSPRPVHRADEAQYEEVSWDELERTSLIHSVEELLNLNASRQEAEAEERKRKEEEAVASKLKQQHAAQQQERQRLARLEEQSRILQHAQREADARKEARQEAEAWTAQHMKQTVEALKRTAQEHELERSIFEVRVDQQKRSLKKKTSLLFSTACLIGSWMIGSLIGMNHNSHDEFSQLRAAAAQVEAEALEKVASLKSELETSRFLLDSDRALLLQALDKAQDEAAVAHNAMENMVQHGQLASPQKLASGPLGTHTKTASATQTTVTGPSQAPQPVASNDFLFSTNDCDRHDPLCGNL